MKSQKRLKKRLLRFTGIVSVAAMLIGNLSAYTPISAAADNTSVGASAVKSDEYAVTTATATLGKSLVQNGFESVNMANITGAINVTKDGKQGWLLDKSQGTNKASVNLNLSSTFKHNKKDGSVYEIEVDYYDSGNGYLRLYYDSYTDTKMTAATVYTDKANKWKTLKVTVDDAAFEKRCDGKCDISVSIAARSIGTPVSNESIAVSEVRVKRIAAKNPIYVTPTIDETANAFKWFSDKKIVHNKLENLTDTEKTVNVTYKAMSENYVKVFEKTEKLTFAPNETKDIDVDLGEVKRCDIYKYYVEVTSDDGKINSVFCPFEFSVIKTDPDGIKNDAYFAAHLDRYPEAQRKMGVEMVKNSNSAGVRSSFEWEYFESQKGTFDASKMAQNKVLDDLLDKDLHYLNQLSATNSQYGMINYKDYPDTPEELEAFGKYVSNAVAYLDGKVDGIEVFNEPNINSFNLHVDKGADVAAKVYVDCLKVAYEEIKKVNPDMKVGGPVLCYINNEKGKDFFNYCMEYGMWQYLDALDLHPYANNFVEKTGLQEHIEWYKEEFEKVGKGDIEFWYSEMGFTTADTPVGDAYTQGAWNTSSVIFYKAKKFGDKFVFYNLEKKGTIDTDREDNFGHTSPGYVDAPVYGKYFVPRKSYLMVTAMNYYMPQTTVLDSYYSADGNLSVNLFKSGKFNTNVLTYYSMNGRRTATFDLGVKSIKYGDEYGNEIEMASDNGIYTFTADKAPVFILGDIEKAVLLEESEDSKVKGGLNAYTAEVPYNDQYTIEVTAEDGYEIQMDAPDCVKNINIADIKDGIGYVTFTSTANAGDEYTVCVKLVKDGKITSLETVNIKGVDTANITASVNLINNNNLNRWQAEFHIENHSETIPVRGKVRIKSPSSFETDYTDIGLVPCKTVGRVLVNLPEIRKKGEYNVEYELVLDNGAVISSSDKIDFTLAKYAEDKPTIDGKTDKNEWSKDIMMYAENDYQIKQITDWKGVNDLSAKSCIEWDEENMYLFCEVTDDIFNQPEPAATCYKGDSVQFGVFYGDEVQVAIGQKNTSYHEIALSKTPDGAKAYRYLSQDNCYEKGDITDKCELAIEREGNKTIYECKIPWEALLMPGQKPKLGDRLGFSFLVNDNDGGGRRGWIEYASGIGESKDTTLFTYLKLIK